MNFPHKIRFNLVFKLILAVGITLLLSIAIWAHFNIKYQKEKLMGHIIEDVDRLSNTVRLGAHYAMMSNSRDDINQIIKNISQQKDIKNIRIYNKKGEIKYSNTISEMDMRPDKKTEGCSACHLSDPPALNPDLSQRTRIYSSPKGFRQLEIVSPIFNEPECSSGICHVHPGGKKILGILDVVFSLEETDKAIFGFKRGIIGLAIFVFLITSTIIFVFVLKFVSLPIKNLITGTQRIAKGDYFNRVDIQQEDELGQLASAINQMGKDIGEKQGEINRQRNEYQRLFEQVPCLITVQDREYRLIEFNREFSEKFRPEPGDTCYHAYKGRDSKCDICPVEKTFKDGKSHYGEETGKRKDGTVSHWIVRTSPLRDAQGEIIAAMEMSLDITHSRKLEEKLQESEKKYQEVFNNMPNPAFVMHRNTLEILDCNQSVKRVYGYTKKELVHTSFLDFFKDKGPFDTMLESASVLNRIRHLTKAGDIIYVDIWISPSTYDGQTVYLVTTSDITQRLETEQQLIQAGKMATLGEMATGVAHELNQPLSVIKTASSFCVKKVLQKEEIESETLHTLLNKIDSNVDRATKIIAHMRQFARKADLKLVTVQMNDVLKKAFEIFSQQLRLRNIEVDWNLEKNLPTVKADPGRIEQVFINLLINARDAIEEKCGTQIHQKGEKKITLRTWSEEKHVFIEVCDSGSGISEVVANKIFEPFFTTKEVGKGTGLGLSISYGIVKDCLGSIRVKPTSAKGTCFLLTFPSTGENNG
ncbi:PAS domain S-box protein [Thermodesulfobacteriota bacterium]